MQAAMKGSVFSKSDQGETWQEYSSLKYATRTTDELDYRFVVMHFQDGDHNVSSR